MNNHKATTLEAQPVLENNIKTFTQQTTREYYLNWFFKKKQQYVVLRQFKDPRGATKMYIILPVKEREFVSASVDLFDKTKLDDGNLAFNSKNIKDYETIYSGHMDNFTDFPRYLNTFKFTKRNPSTKRWAQEEVVKLYKDYTKTKVEQEHSFSLVASFIEPELSIVSIFRLLQTKYITVVAVTFQPLN